MFFRRTLKIFAAIIFIFNLSGCDCFHKNKTEIAPSPLVQKNEETKVIPLGEENSEEMNYESDPCPLENYMDPLEFCEVDKNFIESYVEWQNLEVQMGERYSLVVPYGNWEMQRTFNRLLLKDKQNEKFYLSNKAVWDAALMPDENTLLISAIFHIEPDQKEQYLTTFTQLFKISSKEISDFARGYDDASGLDSLSILVKVSLPDRKIEYLPYLGGEEIVINKDKIIFTQFTKMGDWFYCYNQINIEEVDCHKMKIPVLEIDQKSYKILKNYTVAEFGEIKSGKNITTYDLYTDNDENTLKKVLKLLDT